MNLCEPIAPSQARVASISPPRPTVAGAEGTRGRILSRRLLLGGAVLMGGRARHAASGRLRAPVATVKWEKVLA